MTAYLFRALIVTMRQRWSGVHTHGLETSRSTRKFFLFAYPAECAKIATFANPTSKLRMALPIKSRNVGAPWWS